MRHRSREIFVRRLAVGLWSLEGNGPQELEVIHCVRGVMIATCGRPDLLARRSLPSVQRQTRRPDFLVVVDDSSPTGRPDNRHVVNELQLSGTRIVYLTNTRAPGASGAWNTGLEWLKGHVEKAEHAFVAI